jgi:membrane protease YdiL (CAAX protease family)
MNASPPGEPSPVTTPPIPRWRWSIHLILIAGYVLVVGLMGLSHPPNQAPMLPRNSQGLLIVASTELAMFGIIFGLAWLASRASRDDLLLRWRGGPWIVPISLGYSVALRLALAIVMMIVSGVLVATGAMSFDSLQEFFRANQPRTEAMVDSSVMRSDPLYFLLLLTLISFVVAGLREELWRSAFLAGLRALGPKYLNSLPGQIAAVTVVAVVFGIGHLSMGWLAVAMTTVLGFGLGIIMLLHRSIWPAVIAHGMFDAATFLLLRWLPLQDL